MKLKSYSFPVNLNIPTELLALPILEILGKEDLQTPTHVFLSWEKCLFLFKNQIILTKIYGNHSASINISLKLKISAFFITALKFQDAEKNGHL